MCRLSLMRVNSYCDRNMEPHPGSPSRSVSTMSLSICSVRRLGAISVTRSQSFNGITTYDKPYRKPSRSSKMFTMSTKSNLPPKIPQPERVDQVYEALKRGLQCCLHVYQMDLDNLSKQMKESKRNSRLGFLYELDKQVKVIERYIRRLEFHLSKIEEIYEAYCLQRRLRDGANKMVKAYNASPGSKEARESLAEASKGYKEYTENMCVLECELENHLGEFHIRMKGLAGFARLCAGDQYEIFMKYGRQRWKLKGRIEINAKQVWDNEEMLFFPLINEFLLVKVTELKSLANHVVVGSVSCETKDLFTALTQTVAVDINDLGTIKLSLEVTWSPFDKDDQGSVASTVYKAPTISKRSSTIFNQSLPDTPSLREQAFYKMLCRHEEFENGAAWSNSSESSDDSSSPQMPVGGLRSSTQHKAAEVIKGGSSAHPHISFCSGDSSSSTLSSTYKVNSVLEDDKPKEQAQSNRIHENTGATKADDDEEDVVKESSSVTVDEDVTNSHTSHSYLRSLSHISESSADSVVLKDRSGCESEEVTSLASGISINDIEMAIPNRSPEPAQVGGSVTDVLKRTGVMETNVHNKGSAQFTDEQDTSAYGLTSSSQSYDGICPNSPSPINTHADVGRSTLPEVWDETFVARRVPVVEEVSGTESDGPGDSGLKDALGVVLSSLDDYRGQFPEIQLLEQELKLLQVTLQGGRHSRSPSVVSLNVKTALGSFDFLNMCDGEEEEEEKGDERSRNGRSLESMGYGNMPYSNTSPLTTGCTTLDCALMVHLRNCNAQLLCLGMFGPLRCGEMYALDRLLREGRVLKLIRHVIEDNPRRMRQPSEVVPQLDQCLGAVSLWKHCVGQASVYSVSAESFLVTLCTTYGSTLPERAGSLADTVFLSLVERVLDQRLPRRRSSRDDVMVTLFQLWSYLEANGISDIKAHIMEVAEEVWLVHRLASGNQDVIVQTLRQPAESSLGREGLHAVVKLLGDPRGKVSAATSSLLRSLAAQPKQRELALVSCLELLEDENVEMRVCGCKALSCLKAKESIDQLVYLCRTDKDEVREAAKQALLLLGNANILVFCLFTMIIEILDRFVVLDSVVLCCVWSR
ncbi:rho family-interacting cell polarization regulator 1 isoform X3 [Betta splendens]|uniref:Rho family-interacting cell polarization regulator 1 isoform X3 n=2 Tax=Betta splendens TaxID=158456 RepID=A0A6P7MNE0_BETSP|nr:rho family-interacting cell polarization regulator 1 isoform X3 [Betta splendens]